MAQAGVIDWGARRLSTRPDEFRAVASTVPPDGDALTRTLRESESSTDGQRVLAVRQVLDRTYEIRGLLGEGGMGQVYDAFDVRLKRRAAIKVARPDGDPSVLRQEAQALAQVRHPCVLSVYGLHVHDGLEYLVMERIHGITLEQHLGRLRETGEVFTIEEALDLLIGIVDGLCAIHRAGLSHRDIKPANIMIAPGNRVVLMDFGLAVPNFLTDETASEFIVGTPEYMAPESIRSIVRRGAAHFIDLYAVGIVAFEILAGEPPFWGATVRDTLIAHLGEEPPPLLDHRANVPEALANLVTRLLAKNTDERPESAAALLAELRAIRAHRDCPSGAEPFSILIADDDELMRVILKQMLADAIPNAQIAVAESGAAAIRCVRAHPPDVLVLDLEMPDVSGLEVCMFLRGTHLAERVKIVLVSGQADARDVALLRQLGITEYLPKSESLHKELVRVLGGLRAAAAAPG
jgi:serine/threonine-protein kinase